MARFQPRTASSHIASGYTLTHEISTRRDDMATLRARLAAPVGAIIPAIREDFSVLDHENPNWEETAELVVAALH